MRSRFIEKAVPFIVLAATYVAALMAAGCELSVGGTVTERLLYPNKGDKTDPRTGMYTPSYSESCGAGSAIGGNPGFAAIGDEGGKK